MKRLIKAVQSTQNHYSRHTTQGWRNWKYGPFDGEVRSRICTHTTAARWYAQPLAQAAQTLVVLLTVGDGTLCSSFKLTS
eukprot:6202989-Pleurochrysis_carterae.AAC.1